MLGSRSFRRLAGALAAGALCLPAAAQQTTTGANVRLTDTVDVAQFTTTGAVGGVRAYAIGSYTCNVGNADLLWLGQGTPGLAQNTYRLYDGRIEQIGQGWVKHSCCAAESNNCGLTCVFTAGSNLLGPGCRDVYSAGYNGGQSRLGPRAGINPFTGQFSAVPGGSNTTISRRIQITQTDMTTAAFPGARYFFEGVYAASDETGPDRLDNATYKPVTINQSTFAVTPSGAAGVGKPAIYAWREHGLGQNLVDPSVRITVLDVPNEGRFFVGTKVTTLAAGRYRYDYAVFNLTSDRAGGSFTVPVPEGVNVSAVGFKDIDYHSGEPYANTDWTSAVGPAGVTWTSPQTFAANPNSNALRWGTMYNFWFEADRPAADREATLGLFKPHTPQTVAVIVDVPACGADFDGVGGVTVGDIFEFLSLWFLGAPTADFDRSGLVTVDDLFAYLAAWFSGC